MQRAKGVVVIFVNNFVIICIFREPPVFIAAGDIRRRLSESLRQPKALKNFQRDPEDPSASVLKEPWEDKVRLFNIRHLNTLLKNPVAQPVRVF